MSVREVDLDHANAELKRQVAALEEFNQLMSHDLREPLRSISGFTTILRRRITRYPELLRDFDYLESAVDQLSHLHEGVELLRATKEYVPRLKTTHLQATLTDTVAAVKMKYPDLAVALELTPDAKCLLTDSYALSLALRELLENAAKFAQANHQAATITVTTAASRLEIRVADRGLGIDTAYHEQIFTVFKRLHRREEFDGSGIGLAVARLAVEKLGGTLHVEKSRAGEGSTFLLSLPLAVEPTPHCTGPYVDAAPVLL